MHCQQSRKCFCLTPFFRLFETPPVLGFLVCQPPRSLTPRGVTNCGFSVIRKQQPTVDDAHFGHGGSLKGLLRCSVQFYLRNQGSPGVKSTFPMNRVKKIILISVNKRNLYKMFRSVKMDCYLEIILVFLSCLFVLYN